MREQRKVVTVLFCDLVGSTALGESTDPEALRARLRRYFEDLRAILERHGGSVEKFAGDAVMAVFGIPVAHEDDALRAVRAAAEMREAIVAHGLEARIGVNTGEVVVGGEGETLVTGDAVNVAARLEQAAASGEILIGAATRALVRDAIRVEPVEPLVLKGKSEPVVAFRLVEVLSDAAPLARRPETPLVGRERERQRLWRDYEDAVADRTCRLFTLLGPAGIGKSRLVADLLERVGDSADVLRGRCLSYGEGITYWPLVEMLIAIGVEPDTVIGTSPPETQLAFRRLLEARAADRPQVVVIDDLQWAEPVFVDLVEHLADMSRDAPIFLLCIARMELLDARPGWAGGKLNATSLLLEPLAPDECSDLIDRLVHDAALAEDLRERITTASAGNPLYVEEMLAMVREHGGDGEIAVPPTIHALLQARIDSLDADVRVVMERGSVEGEVFHRGSVAVLSPEPVRDEVGSHLSTLVRKELIRSTSPTFPDDEGFRFRHLLIRDTAYESLPKATRAELHERFADWLAPHDLVERDEIVGYHLEQAHRYRAELDPSDPALLRLAERAAKHLATAGTAAIDRGDGNAARTLLGRARALLPHSDRRRAQIAVEASYVLVEAGEMEQAEEVVRDALESDDPVLRARGVLASVELRQVREGMPPESADELREPARALLEEAQDDAGLAYYWRNVGYDSWAACAAGVSLERWERGLAHARAAGAVGIATELVGRLLICLVIGPTPAAEALVRIDEAVDEIGTSAVLEADAQMARGMLWSMQGRGDEGYELVEAGLRTIRESGQILNAAGMVQRLELAERLRGGADVEQRIERVVRQGYEELVRLGDRAYLPTLALILAYCLQRQGRAKEARELCEVARERTLPEDFVNFIYLDVVEGELAAMEERLDEAERRARRAVERAETTDFVVLRGLWSRGVLATVLARRGKAEEAAVVATHAVGLHASKGDVASVGLLREQFEKEGVDVT